MFTPQPYPSLIKYMGSKSKIIDFVTSGLNSVTKKNGYLLDLFAGSASLSGAIGLQHNFISNDIQAYSEILSRTYLESLKNNSYPSGNDIISQAQKIVTKNKKKINLSNVDYSKDLGLDEFNALEKEQKQLLYKDFSYPYHLFTKNYSGTWWSYEQCIWIDAIREIAEFHCQDSIYPFILSSLMYAMAYSSQGTGHYAQYRDANTISSLNDICIYRRKNVSKLFEKKYDEVCNAAKKRNKTYTSQYMSLDYKEALNNFEGGTVYADPPYCFVHYSRFYHILETLVLYDYPEIQQKNGSVLKGRYRVDRHQSPFCIKSQVEGAFIDLFNGVKKTNSSLVLSYSNTGMLDLASLIETASEILPSKNIEILTTNYQHMTLGRKGQRFRDVKECLILAQ